MVIVMSDKHIFVNKRHVSNQVCNYFQKEKNVCRNYLILMPTIMLPLESSGYKLKAKHFLFITYTTKS